MKRFILSLLILAMLGSEPGWGMPPRVGEIAADVGYSEGRDFLGSNYRRLVQRRVGDHSDAVLALVFATPW